jgi:hypothetical protein
MKRSSCVVAAVLFSMIWPFTFAGADNNVSRARMDIKNIEKALEVYKAKHGSFPPDLLTLTQPDENEAALLKAEAVVDPWKRPYQYERGRLDPNTGIPQIWTDGFDPANPSRKIANWPPPPPPAFWAEVVENIPGYAALLLMVVVLALFCVAFKFWDDGKIGGWVVLVLLLLAVGWIAFLGLWSITTVLD